MPILRVPPSFWHIAQKMREHLKLSEGPFLSISISNVQRIEFDKLKIIDYSETEEKISDN